MYILYIYLDNLGVMILKHDIATHTKYLSLTYSNDLLNDFH